MHALVTGATGFIGRVLCEQLLQSGWAITAWSHSGGSVVGELTSRPIELAGCTPGHEDFAGVDVVFHTAGIAHQSAAPAAYEAVNHQATLALARAASAAGVPRFIFLSSVKAMGPPTSPASRSETECSPPQDPYGNSKLDAELGLQTLLGPSGCRLVIVRPTLVYGPQAAGNLLRLWQAMKRGAPVPPARGLRSMVSRDELVRLLLLAATEPDAEGVYIASDNEPYSANAICNAMRQALGRGPGRAWLPLPVWALACALLDRKIGGDTYQRLFGTETYSNRRAQEMLGWQPEALLTRDLSTWARTGAET